MLTLKVTGMTCGGCVQSVQRAILAAAPGAKVKVDLPTGQVTIEGAAAKAEIIAAIEDAGYDVAA